MRVCMYVCMCWNRCARQDWTRTTTNCWKKSLRNKNNCEWHKNSWLVLPVHALPLTNMIILNLESKSIHYKYSGHTINHFVVPNTHRSMILIPSRVQADVEEQEKEKAEDLKELESKLVSVLMEQQKRMLSVVGSVASASSSLKAVGKFNKKRLKNV